MKKIIKKCSIVFGNKLDRIVFTEVEVIEHKPSMYGTLPKYGNVKVPLFWLNIIEDSTPMSTMVDSGVFDDLPLGPTNISIYKLYIEDVSEEVEKAYNKYYPEMTMDGYPMYISDRSILDQLALDFPPRVLVEVDCVYQNDKTELIQSISKDSDSWSIGKHGFIDRKNGTIYKYTKLLNK